MNQLLYKKLSIKFVIYYFKTQMEKQLILRGRLKIPSEIQMASVVINNGIKVAR